MKKILIRISAMVLALIMLLSIVACSDKEAEETSTEESNGEAVVTDGVEENEIKPNFSGNTYGGRDFNVLTRKNMMPNIIAVEELSSQSSILEKAIYDRNKTVEEQFDISFKFLIDSEGKIRDEVALNALAGADVYDLVNNQGRTLMLGVVANYYLDWNTLPVVNLDAPWWGQGFKTDLATPGGKNFIMNGDISYGYWGAIGGVFFNQDMIKNAGATSPYTYYEQGNWTYESFYQTVREVSASLDVEDGKAGYVNQKYRGVSCVYRQTGYQVLELQGDGTYTLGIKNDKTYTIVDEFATFVFESGCCLYEEDLSTARKLFQTEAVAFFDDAVYSATEYGDMNFGFVPWPTTEPGKKSDVGVGSGNTSFAIPANTSEANRACIGDVVEALAYYGREKVTDVYLETFISYQKFKDPTAAEILESLRDDIRANLADYLNPAKVGDIGTLMLTEPSTYPSLVTTIEKLTSNGQLEVDLQLWYALDNAN